MKPVIATTQKRFVISFRVITILAITFVIITQPAKHTHAGQNNRVDNWRERNSKWIENDASSESGWRKSNLKWLKDDTGEKDGNWRIRNTEWISDDSSPDTRWRKADTRWLREDSELSF